VSHFSCASTSTAPASRRRAAGLGKASTTSVRRLISWFSRSSGLVDQTSSSARPKRGEGEQVPFGVAQHTVDCGKIRPSMPAMTSSWESARARRRAPRRSCRTRWRPSRRCPSEPPEPVAREVHPAPLPTGIDRQSTDGDPHDGTGVGADQLGAGEPSTFSERRNGSRRRRPLSHRRRKRALPGARRRLRWWRSRRPGTRPAG
jgi:hypothetical protein